MAILWYCRQANAYWTNPQPAQPYFLELGASPLPRGRGKGIASTTDPVGKPKLFSLFIKLTQFRLNREPSRKFARFFHRKPNVQCNTQTVPWCQKSVLFFVKQIQILNKRSRLWTKEDKLVKLHAGHIFIRYRIRIYSLPLLQVSG